MARRTNYNFEKRQREIKKKKKAQEKLDRRMAKNRPPEDEEGEGTAETAGEGEATGETEAPAAAEASDAAVAGDDKLAE